MHCTPIFHVILGFACTLLLACNTHRPPVADAKNSLPPVDSPGTSSPSRPFDTLDMDMRQTMYLPDSNFLKTPLNPALATFLRQPIDLQAFKKTHQGPNTTGFRAPGWMHRPQQEGFFMGYFIFPGFGEHGPEMVVYRSGKAIGDFNDDRDILVQFSLDRHDPLLGDADLLDKSIADLEARFGKVHLRQGAFLYYRDQAGHLLSLCVGKGNTVEWYKWMHLSYNVNHLNDVPKEARDSKGI